MIDSQSQVPRNDAQQAVAPDSRERRAGTGKSGGVRVIYFTRTAEEEVVLLLIYAKSKTDNITGTKLKEIRRVIEN